MSRTPGLRPKASAPSGPAAHGCGKATVSPAARTEARAGAAPVARSAFIARGLRFECQGCGACCVNHGDATTVFVTLADRRRLAAYFKAPTQVFTRRWCRRVEERWALVDADDGKACVFLVPGKGCRVYEARPTQCRTWPFWPELLNARAWRREVARGCPGAGRGPVHDPGTIEAIAAEQRKADEAG